jgi:fibronectin type 3 domain-containing protein
MKISRRLYSALFASDLSRNSCCDGATVGLHTGLIQNRIMAVIRSTAVVAASLWLLSGSLALAQTTQSVSLAWDAETDPSVVGYNVHYGTSRSSLTKTQNVGASTTATVSGLTTGTTYYFTVTAYNAAGINSTNSNEVSYTPTSTPTPTPTPAPAPTHSYSTISLSRKIPYRKEGSGEMDLLLV